MSIPEADNGSRESTREEQIIADEPRNIFVLAAYYITLRASWIFKTESVIIPRFLDVIHGSAFIRSFLPLLNRAGQSIPPLFVADRLRRAPLKRRVLLVSGFCLSLVMLSLASLWLSLGETTRGWMPYAFLALYVSFFVANGVNQITMGTLQGKLVRANRRGRLLAFSGVVGSFVSISLAWFLLRPWLSGGKSTSTVLGFLPTSGYALIFGFAGLGFASAAMLSRFVREPIDDEPVQPGRSPLQSIRDAWAVFRQDRAFRRAGIVAMLYISVQFLFPHFQAYGRKTWGDQDEGVYLTIWVIAQNASVGAFSFVSGLLADRFGNRLAIRIQVFLCALTPLFALLLDSNLIEDGRRWFWIAFVFLGLVPVTMRSFVNYTLELTEPANHPRYVSTMSLCLAFPFLLSPVVGALIDTIGFKPMFIFIAATTLLGGLLTFRMTEPRDHVLTGQAGTETPLE